MRRDFLKACGLAGLGLAAPVLRPSARAATDEPYAGPFYVVFNAAGGWDTTYLMDPKGANGVNRLYRDGDILTHGAHRFAPVKGHAKGGMTNEDFYAEFGRELLAFNGLDYSTNNHSPGARYMATGKLDGLTHPTFAALVAACRGPACPLAFLTFGNYSATGNLVPMSRVPYLASLKKIANPDAADGNETAPYHAPFALDRIERALLEEHESRAAEPRLPRAERAEGMLYAAQANSKALQRVTRHIPAMAPKDRLALQAEIALAAFKAGVGVSANLTIGQFDSHANNDADQMKLLPELLAGVAHLLRRAADLNIRDQLVVVVQSEMGRTPTYNAGNGKDHWSVGSALFLGRGVAGNRVVGATDAGQFAVPLDPQSLKLDKEKGVRVRPEHVHTALRELAGVADHPLSKRFPLGVTDADRLRGFWG